MKARDLQEGTMINGEPIVDYLHDNGYMPDWDFDGQIVGVEEEYCEVDKVEIETHKVTGEDIAVVYTFGGNWAIPADFEVELAPE